MNIIITIIVFLAGLAVGSFLNVVILRIDDLKSILNTRSKCPHCKETLKWYDLFPFISFVLLRGKCRYCEKKISWQYPLVELGVATLFMLLYFQFQLSWALAFYALVFTILTVIFAYDLKYQLVPDEFVWLVLIIILAGSWYFGGFNFLNMIIGGLIGGGAIALLVVISKEKWMGAGDIKIAAALGALVGYPQALLVLFLAFVIGSLFGIGLIIFNKKGLKDSLPFAPFLISSALITLFFGNMIIFWYLERLSI